MKVLLALAAAAACASAASPDLITALPGWTGSQALYGGYVKVNATSNRNIFYFLVESAGSPSADPLVIWTNGGPGCSSLAGGLITEMGPFFPSPTNASELIPNPYSWTRYANVLYVEHPAGVGFSFSDNPADYTVGDAMDSADLYAFLQGFYKVHPEYVGRALWLTGESYGGHYVPNFAAEIVRNNLAGANPQVNFAGIQVGNAWTNAAIDNTGAVTSWLGFSTITQEVHDGILLTCDMENVGPLLARSNTVKRALGDSWHPLGFRPRKGADGKLLTAKRGDTDLTCNEWVDLADTSMQGTNIYDAFVDICTDDQRAAILRGEPTPLGAGSDGNAGCAGFYDPCAGDRATVYFNRADVKRAIHANVSIIWEGCSSVVDYSYTDLLSSMLPVWEYLLENAPDASYLVYSGDVDMIVPLAGTRSWLPKLNLPIVEDWHPYMVNGQVGGWSMTYGPANPGTAGLTFASVRNAGHEVPQYQQDRSLYLFRQFLQGQPL